MNQSEAEQVYLYHVERTEALLNSMGDNPQAKNAFITNTYAAFSQKDPVFLWFSLGAIVSGTVGRNLQFATQAAIHTAGKYENTNVILEKFGEGNQAIFKNIVPLYLTYESIGIEGIGTLANCELINPFQKKLVLDAMKAHSFLKIQQSTIAQSLGLALNDPKIIGELFLDKKNIGIIHTVAMGIADEEQKTVQKIYQKDLVDALFDPKLAFGGHQYQLDGIKILDKTYFLFDYVDNPEDFDQRLAFAEILLTAVEEGISKGEFSKFQTEVLEMAEHTLWIANPNTAANAIGETNGIYWAQQAEEHDKKIKDSVLAFINNEPEQLNSNQETAIKIFNDEAELNIFPAIFTGENEIVKINVDPLAYFLETNPNYEVIAHDITELWNSSSYYRTPFDGGTKFWNPNLSYLGDKAYLLLYTDGIYIYYQPDGEVRGIAFPFIYDKTTGVPLTMPIVDPLGHYSTAPTMETLYNNPELFNTPSHPHWYNPYWNKVVNHARIEALSHYFKSITIDNVMNAAIAPFVNTIHYNNSNVQLELKIGDIFHDHSGNIDFSHVNGTSNAGNPLYTMAITSMELANGTLLEVNPQGHFVCANCNHHMTSQLENAANSILNYI